jgi:hypothetical protein
MSFQLKALVLSTIFVASTSPLRAQPTVNQSFSAYQQQNIPAKDQSTNPIQVPIFVNSYNEYINSNEKLTIGIYSDFLKVCSIEKINFTSSDSSVATIQKNQFNISLTAHYTGIDDNKTALITATCGRYTDSLMIHMR